MDVRPITASDAELHLLQDLARPLGADAGFVWGDIGEWDDTAERVLTGIFRFNPMAIRECSQRNQVPQVVTAGHLGDPEQFQEDLFRVRHWLLTVQTMCSLSQQVYGRMRTIAALGQKDYLQGTIEFDQTRTTTKITIAAERLAVIAAVTLPVTALSSILGMNVIVNDSTQVPELAIWLTVMLVMSILLFIRTKRLGWW